MGSTLPSITEQLNQTEAALARFRSSLAHSDQDFLDGLFSAARKHSAGITQIDALLPIESALLSIVLEQAKDLSVLRQEIDVYKRRVRAG